MATVEEIKRPTLVTTSDGHRQRSRFFEVIGVTTPTPSALGIEKGSVYVDTEGTVDGGCLARDIRWDPDERIRSRYKVTVNYDSRPRATNNTTATGGSGVQDNPLAQPPKFSASGMSVRKVLTHDLEGKPIQNTAGAPLADSVETDEPRALVRITKHEPAFFIDRIVQFYMATNNAPWLGIPKYQAKVVEISASQERTEFDITYVTITYGIEIGQKDLGVVEIPNMGYQVKIDGNVDNLDVAGFDDADANGLGTPWLMDLNQAKQGKRRAVVKDGLPIEIPGPVYLNANGNQWVEGLDPEEDKVLFFVESRAVDFNILSAPGTTRSRRVPFVGAAARGR